MLKKLKKNKLIVILLFSLILFSLIGLGITNIVNADEFLELGSIEELSTIKEYNETTKTVTIFDSKDSKEVATIKLDTPLIVKVPVGYQKVAEFTLDSYNLKSINPLEKVSFYNLNKDSSEISGKEYDYKYWGSYPVDDYSYICDEEKINCSSVVTGSHLEYGWLDYNSSIILKGKYRISIWTNVNLGDKVEWVPSYYGVEIKEWAVYEQSSGSKYYIDIEGVNYTIFEFTSDGTFNLTNEVNVTYLIVAGGGGGGTVNQGGGGGAGGFLTGYMNMSGNFTVDVGLGGDEHVAGQNSSLNSTLLAWGGGDGGSGNQNGGTGGSGGGAGWNGAEPGDSISGQGNNGGDGNSGDYADGRGGAGGGGASSAGGPATADLAGYGGNGSSSSINGTVVYYSGGGGGGALLTTDGWGTSKGLGGSGGGGNGSLDGTVAQSGINGTGGGGGGSNGVAGAGKGGSGIIILRVKTSDIEPPTVDTTVPSVSVIYPLNTTYPSARTSFNFSISDDNIDICWYALNSSVNVTTSCSANVTGISSVEGSNTWTIWANDTYGNVNSSSVTFSHDTTAPIITITNPTEGETEYSSSVVLSVTTDETSTCSYSINEESNISLGTGTSFSQTLTLIDGIHTFRIFCNDSVGNQNLTGAFVSFNIYSLGGAVDTGGGGGGTWDVSNINLDSVKVNWDDFYFNKEAYIYIMPLDKDGNIVNISKITIEIIEENGIKYKEWETIKLNDNSYKKLLNISFLNNSNSFNVSIKVEQNSKTISKNVLIPILEEDLKKLSINERFFALESYWMENWMMISFFVVILLLIIILFKGNTK